MSNYGPDSSQMENPISTGGLAPEKAVAVLVIGSMVFLIAVARGFRGVSVSGATGGLVK